MSLPPRLPWRGPPLALQITALLLGGLVVAQLVTLFLTLTASRRRRPPNMGCAISQLRSPTSAATIIMA
jgi:hypothetical protein